jgi:hypothetical protein
MTERYKPPLEGEILPALARLSKPERAEYVPRRVGVKGRMTDNGGRTRGPLFNNRHERFAQGLVRGMSPRQAYVYAGFEGEIAKNKNPSLLYNNRHVQRRVAELQERAAERAIISVPEILKGLKEIAKKRAATKNPLWADKLRAYEMLGKALNMFKPEEANEVAVTIVVDSSEAAY